MPGSSYYSRFAHVGPAGLLGCLELRTIHRNINRSIPDVSRGIVDRQLVSELELAHICLTICVEHQRSGDEVSVRGALELLLCETRDIVALDDRYDSGWVCSIILADTRAGNLRIEEGGSCSV